MINSPAGNSLNSRCLISRTKVLSAVSETTIALKLCGKAIMQLLGENFSPNMRLPNIAPDCQEPARHSGLVPVVTAVPAVPSDWNLWNEWNDWNYPIRRACIGQRNRCTLRLEDKPWQRIMRPDLREAPPDRRQLQPSANKAKAPP